MKEDIDEVCVFLATVDDEIKGISVLVNGEPVDPLKVYTSFVEIETETQLFGLVHLPSDEYEQ